MKLKHLALIELIIRIFFIIIGLPFKAITQLLQWIQSPFIWVGNKFINIANIIGNRLLKVSNEVKNGTIKDKYVIKNYTAIQAKRHLLWAQKTKE